LKVTVKRANGHKAKLQLTAKNLPDGVTAAPAEIAEKSSEATLKVAAAGDAKAAGQPFTLILRETEGGAERTTRFFMTTGGENNGVPQGYGELVIGSTDQLWLTVPAVTTPPEQKKADDKRPEEKKQ
jgi:hypothetical protein